MRETGRLGDRLGHAPGKFLTQLSSTGNDLPEFQDPLKAP